MTHNFPKKSNFEILTYYARVLFRVQLVKTLAKSLNFTNMNQK